MAKGLTLEEWEGLAERGTSGDMVWDILGDWKAEQEVYVQQLDTTKPILCAWCHQPYGHQGDDAAHLSSLHNEHRKMCTKLPGSEVRNLLLNMKGKLWEVRKYEGKEGYLVGEEYMDMIEETVNKLLSV